MFGNAQGGLRSVRAVLTAVALVVCLSVPLLSAGCASPPQIVTILPGRGAGDVPTNQPIEIVFDRAMDEASVSAHFHLIPSSPGRVHWQNQRTMLFEHPALTPSSRYQAVLEGGYRDSAGGVNGLRHDWQFRTEGPPAVSGSTPAEGDRGIDPSTYLAITFSRPMDLSSLSATVSLGPSIPIAIRADPADPRRVLIAPQGLLYPDTTYALTVLPSARDVHGNHLEGGAVVTFTTGARQPLKHWVSFAATPERTVVGSGIWIVNDIAFPRRLVPVTVSSFTWSADGTRLLSRARNGSWSVLPVNGGSPTPLPVTGTWAAFVTGGAYAFLDGGTLRMLTPGGQVTDVATGVTEAAVSPGGERIAFTVPSGTGSEIDAYDVNVHTRYRLDGAQGPIDQLAWAPDGQAIAYRLGASDPAQRQIEVRTLTGTGSTVTVATGRVSSPQWQAGSRNVLFQATVDTDVGPVAKVFVRSLAQQAPPSLNAAGAIPVRNDLDLQSFAVSPDGREIAFIGAAGGHTSVWWMNADGTGVTQLTAYDSSRFPYSATDLSWTPS